MKEKFVTSIKEELAEKESIYINVSIECEEINLQNCHNLEVTEIAESEEVIELETDVLTFTVGKNYTDLSFNEYENDYIFEYANGVVIHIAFN